MLYNVDKHDRALLIWTARNGYPQAVVGLSLSTAGGCLNRQDKFGYMGLIMTKGRLEVVRVLLECGAGFRVRIRR